MNSLNKRREGESEEVAVPVERLAEAVERVRAPLQLEQTEARGREEQRAAAPQVAVLLAVFVEIERAPNRVAPSTHHQHHCAAHLQHQSHTPAALSRVLHTAHTTGQQLIEMHTNNLRADKRVLNEMLTIKAYVTNGHLRDFVEIASSGLRFGHAAIAFHAEQRAADEAQRGKLGPSAAARAQTRGDIARRLRAADFVRNSAVECEQLLVARRQLQEARRTRTHVEERAQLPILRVAAEARAGCTRGAPERELRECGRVQPRELVREQRRDRRPNTRTHTHRTAASARTAAEQLVAPVF